MSTALDILTYADERHPRLKRWIIRGIENLSGRRHYAALYEIWRQQIVPSGHNLFTEMLRLTGIGLAPAGVFPPRDLPDGPLIIVANHPYGIGDGAAALALAEQLGRPFKVIINNALLRVPEMRPYALPVDFEETKEAMATNLAMRREALAFLKSGGTIIIFPAGGVATAPKGLGRAVDLPWKGFVASLIHKAQAHVLPVFFEGQNSRMFHIVSQFSLTLRLSLLVREFTKLSGRSIVFHTGKLISPLDLAAIGDRKLLIDHLRHQVEALDPIGKR
ncbi:MAG: lysophospholipid acyltransferase family protein [Rhizobiaceae bacterium]|jgi:putative hemolysin|nr:lysophospholipid acyltransferase family protein [Rhizobiaceae bacterium]